MPSVLLPLKRRFVKGMPSAINHRFANVYNRVLEWRADRVYARKRPPQSETDPEAPSHIVLFIVDCLRADDFQDTEAMGSLSSTTAVTPSPWTYPAVSSILSGRYPHEHGAMRQSDGLDDDAVTGITLPPKMDIEKGLTEYLTGAGYETYGAFPFYIPFHAAKGRFDAHRVYNDTDAEAILDDFLDWIAKHRDGYTFSYVHLSDLHVPVDPPATYWHDREVDESIPDIRNWDYLETSNVDDGGERYRRQRRELYRAALDYVDDQLGRVMEELNDRLGEAPLVIVTGDHGEAFWEHMDIDIAHFEDQRDAHGVGHGATPYEAVARVPLASNQSNLVAGDGLRSLVDLAPTVCDLAGSQYDDMTGTSLLEQNDDRRRPLVEASRYGYEKKAVYDGDWKLIVSRGDDTELGFELPEEQVTKVSGDVRKRLIERLPEWPDGDTDDSAEVSPAVAERLEELGYR